MRIHCGKHDKIFDDETEKCPGCKTEKNSTVKGPDDTLAELRGVNTEHKNIFEKALEKVGEAIGEAKFGGQ